MKEIPMTATRRDKIGKGVARRTRAAGQIPGVVYGPEIEPMPVAVEEREFRAAMKSADASTILNLNVNGKENKVLVRQVQRHPVTSKVIHVDFHAISMNKPINVQIPIHFVGTPVGVKTDGGIMQTTLREIEISCLPKDIPDHFEIDVSELGIGESIHVSNLSIPEAEILTVARRTVVTIAAPTVVKAATTGEGAEAEEEAEAEGAAEEKDEDKAEE